MSNTTNAVDSTDETTVYSTAVTDAINAATSTTTTMATNSTDATTAYSTAVTDAINAATSTTTTMATNGTDATTAYSTVVTDATTAFMEAFTNATTAITEAATNATAVATETTTSVIDVIMSNVSDFQDNNQEYNSYNIMYLALAAAGIASVPIIYFTMRNMCKKVDSNDTVDAAFYSNELDDVVHNQTMGNSNSHDVEHSHVN